MNIDIQEYDDSLRVRRTEKLNKVNITTQPHPGFPTDMQPQMTALLTLAEGTSIINESIWESRFQYTEELNKMGAKITAQGKSAFFEGVKKLSGAPVAATDLRAGAAMIIAALAAKGTTEIENIQFIERGYGDIVNKLKSLGAQIKRVGIQDEIEVSKAL